MHPCHKKIIRYLLCSAALGILASSALLYADAAPLHNGYADYAIVYGSMVNPDASPSPRLQARLNAAIILLSKGNVGWVIVSGGLGEEGYNEAEIMRDYLISNGIAEDKIIVDAHGNTTHLTSRNAARITGTSANVVAVTQRFHVSRAKLSLRSAGFTNVTGYYPDYYEWRDIYSTFREIPAWLSYWLRDK